MSVTNEYLEDVSRFDAFLNLKNKEGQLHDKNKNMTKTLHSYAEIQAMLFELVIELKNKYKASKDTKAIIKIAV